MFTFGELVRISYDSEAFKPQVIGLGGRAREVAQVVMGSNRVVAFSNPFL